MNCKMWDDVWITDKYRERIKVMMVLGMILAMIVAGCAEYGARTNMKNFA